MGTRRDSFGGDGTRRQGTGLQDAAGRKVTRSLDNRGVFGFRRNQCLYGCSGCSAASQGGDQATVAHYKALEPSGAGPAAGSTAETNVAVKARSRPAEERHAVTLLPAGRTDARQECARCTTPGRTYADTGCGDRVHNHVAGWGGQAAKPLSGWGPGLKALMRRTDPALALSGTSAARALGRG